MADHEIRDLEVIAEHRVIEPRQALFREGDKVEGVFSMTAGTVRLQNDLVDGRRQIVGFAIPGDFLGLALNERFAYSAEAVTRVTMCRFDRNRFTRLMDAKPALMRRMHAVASHELGIAQAHMIVLGRRRAEERVAAFLLRWKDRLSVIQGKSATVPLPMGRQDIADHLGLTIETVSRIFARWARAKIVLDVPDGVRVLDEPQLREMIAA
jgi:CRP/FNR family transcriptional regulator